MIKSSRKSKTIKNVIKNDNLENFISNKLSQIQAIIRNTIISIKSNKNHDIFNHNDADIAINILSELYEKSEEIATANKDEKSLDTLQKITDKLMMIICGFGTKQLDDMIYLSFGFEFYSMKIEDPILNAKYELIKQYIQPTGCKIIQWKTPQKKLDIITNDTYCSNKITDDNLNIEYAASCECFDLDKSCNSFYQKIFGIRVIIHNEFSKSSIIINGIVDDIHLDFFSNAYIHYRKNEIKQIANNYEPLEKNIILTILDSCNLKDILIYGNNDIIKKMISVITEVNVIKQNKIDNTIKKILDLDIYSQRNVLIHLLSYKNDDEIQYLCYILYDLLFTNEITNNENIDSQKLLYDSLPSNLKSHFKNIVKYTVKYTNDMMQKYDVHKISLEQQIYLMKANDNVKEKAIVKLKEVKSKSDETGLKAKQYLEGLLKIPFHVYREEPILKKVKDINKNYIRLQYSSEQLFPKMIHNNKKEKYSIVEVLQNVKYIEQYIQDNIIKDIQNTICLQNTKQVLNIVHHINTIKKSKKEKKIHTTNKNKNDFIDEIIKFLTENKDNKNLVSDIFDTIHTETVLSLNKIFHDINTIYTSIQTIESSMKAIEQVLDDSIYSHKNAKNQIMKIIAQWMNGELSGYCFGFEGCPGIGKTSLAKKGLSNCLKDDDNNPRPFAFIALGGSSNGSLLEGHGYTYMNSSWGKIVDILMDTKCMNPIIYIDELDKVSKTENGKEIIHFVTHLIDQTQNDKFQDKYFSGIDIDLSKALFIFSYNDPDQIDKVLLDRIHRIKFDNLTLHDKLIIVKKYIIPEINKKMGFENIVEISEEMIEFIIINYTMEPGVRKLKEIFFDLFGEINLSILKSNTNSNIIKIPIIITKENIENKYLKKYNKIIEKKIHSTPEIGLINGLWANSLAGGGIIPIQAKFFPSSTFLELKLTGLQGDIMKESMNVAKSLAWNLTKDDIKQQFLLDIERTKEQGLHIHCPEGGISKDGPSAGTAITIAIYSLLNNIPINNEVAITGEICLNGRITAIGGLDNKIYGGIRSGIKTFLYPKENHKDFCDWKNKDNNAIKYENIQFIEVSHIDDVFPYVFEVGRLTK